MIKCEHCEARAPNIEEAKRYFQWRRGDDGSFICPKHKPPGLTKEGAWLYDVLDESKSFFVDIEDKYGNFETIRVTLPKQTLVLTHTNGAQIRISRYKHQGKWRFKDSRTGPCTSEHVDELLKRLGLTIDHFVLITDFKSKERYWCARKMYSFAT
jgi:hypothetical protein